MTDNVVTLTGASVVQNKPNETCVRALRELLERAEAGDFVGIACAVLHGDATASYRVCGSVGGYSLVGANECVRAHLVTLNMED